MKIKLIKLIYGLQYNKYEIGAILSKKNIYEIRSKFTELLQQRWRKISMLLVRVIN